LHRRGSYRDLQGGRDSCRVCLQVHSTSSHRPAAWSSSKRRNSEEARARQENRARALESSLSLLPHPSGVVVACRILEHGALDRVSAGLQAKGSATWIKGSTLPRVKYSSTSQLFSQRRIAEQCCPSSRGCRSISFKILGRPLEPPTQLAAALLEPVTEIERPRSSLPFAPP
jgi:hypothetical protein